MNITAHVFALYYPFLHEYQKENSLSLRDADVIHRITRVLRLTEGDTLILFDRSMHAEFIITTITRHTITGALKTKHKNKSWRYSITFFLPILKRESLAMAVYNLVEAGVQEIQLIYTQKTQRTFGGIKEKERLERVVIAAAEQSKNFLFPQLKDPISFLDAIKTVHNTSAYVGDPAGKPVIDILADKERLVDHCALFVGPEGDFSPDEWVLLKKSNMVHVQLTPTILRAEMAAFYLAALFRSMSQ